MRLRDIALNLGLSVTTVSRALADYSDVAQETRRRIRAEAQRIGYVPNALARRLQKGRLDAIGVAAPSSYGALDDSFLSALVEGVWSRLAELRQDLLLLPQADRSPDTAERDLQAFHRAVEERRIDGLVLIRPRRDDRRIDTLLRARLPFVALDGEMRHRSDLAVVGTDEEEAAHMICRRLTTLGQARLACVGPDENYDFVQARFEHLAAAAEAFGLSFEPEVDSDCGAGGRRATGRVVARSATPPSAIVYLSNRMASGGAAVLAGTHWAIGRDVTVAAYGDDHTLRHALPETLVIRPLTHEMGRHAVDTLIARREGRPFDLISRWTPSLERWRDGTSGEA